MKEATLKSPFQERLEEYKRLHTVGKFFGIESHVLSPEETKKLYPLMNVNDIYGTLYSPADGTIDPNGICQSTTRFAKQKGAKVRFKISTTWFRISRVFGQVFEGISVNDIKTENHSYGSKRVTEVVTSQGTIKTSNVVNCTGAWANHITKMVGLKIPLIPMKHAYVTTDRIEGIENMPNVRDHDASVYLKLQGDALHIGGYENNPIFLKEGVEKEFAFGLYELDWEVFGVHIEGAVNRIPCVEKTGIKSTVCGPESFTPDHKPVMGEDPRVRGFFHGCGFNSSGMMLGAGCGKQLAKWVIDGRPDMDMTGYDIRRYCPDVSANDDWVNARSHESYAKNYFTVFPHDEPLAGRNMKKVGFIHFFKRLFIIFKIFNRRNFLRENAARNIFFLFSNLKDPLFDELLNAGCVYQERQGWERPGWFYDGKNGCASDYDWYGAYDNEERDSDYKKLLKADYTFTYPKIHETIRKECVATRNDAALFNMSYFGKFFLSGKDASKAVDWIFTNQISQHNVGKTVYTCMLNSKAGIEADLTVSVIDHPSVSLYDS